tara:strand:+ start:169 stop:786 length:618 start_codon:yes stop_codon:yes gene_type:complete
MYHLFRNKIKHRKSIIRYNQWIKKNKPCPPPSLHKQVVILDYAKKYNIKILVETGTYRGDMLQATKGYFDILYSIELSKNLYSDAKSRFLYDSNINLIQGDSGAKIKEVLKILKQPAIFWLDGHYSSGDTALGDKRTPILDELDNIFNSNHYDHIILIDDARVFGYEKDYPTIDQLVSFIKTNKKKYLIEIKYDCIRLIPESIIN